MKNQSDPTDLPRTGPMRRMLAWTLAWADRPSAQIALFLVAVSEAVFFPIPPDVLLIAMVLGVRTRWFRYAVITSVGSVVGGAIGYAVGAFSSGLALDIVAFYGKEETAADLQVLFGRNAFWSIWVAGFTPVPYKVFAITAGLCREHISIWVMLLASATSRPLRFFLVAIILYRWGPQARLFLEKYFNILTLIFAAIAILGFVLIKPMLSGG